MYAIINVHHDNTWIIPTYANEQRSKEKLVKVWEQIATRFKDYDDHLLFETMNEPREVGHLWNGWAERMKTEM